MSFDSVLYIVFIVLVLLVFFGDTILAYLKDKKASKRREKSETAAPSVSPHKQRQKSLKPKTAPEEKIETVEKPERRAEENTFKPTKPKPEPEAQPRPKPEAKPKPRPKPKPEAEPRPVIKPVETPKVKKELPNKEYPSFDNSRLLGMGLSQEDADAFVRELIEQVETQIPLIESAIESDDYEKVEQLTHSIKGSATNLGTGGIADLLIDFNTYCKKGRDKEIIVHYFAYLKSYLTKLKNQFL